MNNKLKIASILVLFIFGFGCTPYLTEFEKEFHEQTLDFTKYTSNGFLFTPEQYNGEFESCGIIEMEFCPSVKKRDMTLQPGQFYSEGQGKSWVYVPISSNEILDSLYTKSKRLGANAVVRLQIEDFEEDYGPVITPCKRISGYAIKRLKE